MDRKVILIATENSGKAREIRNILKAHIPKGYKILTLKYFKNIPKIRENGRTYFANALKKARTIARKTGAITLADDSGLEVNCLGGKPGIRSARFSEPKSNDKKNLSKLLKLLSKFPDKKRKAGFVCSAVAYFPSSKKILHSSGRVNGIIVGKPKGKNGFGYDPVFYYPEFKKTFAQISPKKKNSISHRSKAFRKLMKKMKLYL